MKDRDAKIRLMQAADLASVLAIENQLFSDAWNEAMFSQEIQQQASYVLEFDGQVAGYICGWFLYEEFNITNLAVASSEQGRGYGTKLVKHIVEQVRQKGFSSIFLEVRASNRAAQKLYENCGFQIVGRRRKYYKNPEEDALIMLTWVKDENER